jgi:hypothetical protein
MNDAPGFREILAIIDEEDGTDPLDGGVTELPPDRKARVFRWLYELSYSTQDERELVIDWMLERAGHNWDRECTWHGERADLERDIRQLGQQSRDATHALYQLLDCLGIEQGSPMDVVMGKIEALVVQGNHYEALCVQHEAKRLLVADLRLRVTELQERNALLRRQLGTLMPWQLREALGLEKDADAEEIVAQIDKLFKYGHYYKQSAEAVTRDGLLEQQLHDYKVSIDKHIAENDQLRVQLAKAHPERVAKLRGQLDIAERANREHEGDITDLKHQVRQLKTTNERHRMELASLGKLRGQLADAESAIRIYNETVGKLLDQVSAHDDYRKTVDEYLADPRHFNGPPMTASMTADEINTQLGDAVACGDYVFRNGVMEVCALLRGHQPPCDYRAPSDSGSNESLRDYVTRAVNEMLARVTATLAGRQQ